MSPRVSVVVPAYQSVDFIDETLRSIREQTFGDFELLVSDHSSTDGTWERIQEHAAADDRITTFRQPAGGGAPANWSAVTERATGELLKLVCGDDLLYPTCLEEQVAAVDRHPDAVLVASQRDILDAEGRTLVRGRGVQGLDGKVSGEAAIRRTVRLGTNIFGEPACVLFRRSVLMEVGGWDSRSPYLIDQASCARVLMRGPMVAIRRPLAAFRVNPGQWSVALAGRQAHHARDFHHRLAVERPDVLSRSDVLLGDVRASGMAYLRRASYRFLEWRSRRG